MPITGTYSSGATETNSWSSVDDLLGLLYDNTSNAITARGVRDGVYTLWDKINNSNELSEVLLNGNTTGTSSIIISNTAFGKYVTQPSTQPGFDDLTIITKKYVDDSISATNELSEVLLNGNTTGTSSIIISGTVSLGKYETQPSVHPDFDDLTIITKKYVDDSISASNELSEVLLNGNTTGTSSIIISNTAFGKYVTQPSTQLGFDDLTIVTKQYVDNISTPVDTTYDGLTSSIASSLLIPGTYYRITDFRTKHFLYGTTDLNIGPTTSLIVMATSDNTIDTRAHQESYPFDYIEYDWSDNTLLVPDITGNWSSGGGPSGTIAISGVTPVTNVFIIDYNLQIYNGFTIEMTDNVNGLSVTYTESSPIGVNLNITDNLDGTWTITPLIFPGGMDVTLGIKGSIQITISQSNISRTGWITRRRETVKNISTPFDFREVKQYRYLINNSGLTYSDATTYSKKDVSIDTDGTIYISLQDDNLNNQPSSGGFWWLPMMTNADTCPYLYDNSSVSGVNFNIDASTSVPLYCFIDDFSTNNFNISTISDFIIDELYSTSETSNIVISGIGSYNIKSINLKNAFGITAINSTLIGITSDGDFYENIFINYANVNYLKTGNFYNNAVYYLNSVDCAMLNFDNLFYDIGYCSLSQEIHDNIFAYCDYNIFGPEFYDNIIMITSKAYRNYFGPSFYNNSLLCSEFSGNHIASKSHDNLIIGTSTSFLDNECGPGFNENQILGNSALKYNKIGSGFNNNIIGSQSSIQWCDVGNLCYSNQFIGSAFTTNRIRSTFASNVISRYMTNNVFDGVVVNNNLYGGTYSLFEENSIYIQFSQNTISSDFNRNFIDRLLTNTITSTFSNCVIRSQFTGNTISNGVNFQYNTFECNVTGVDFSTASHVYGSYSCNIFARQDGTLRLKYMDNTDNYQITDPNL